jgi:hypothetical protein
LEQPSRRLILLGFEPRPIAFFLGLATNVGQVEVVVPLVLLAHQAHNSGLISFQER